MTQDDEFPSHNAVFEESWDHNGTPYWKVFEHVQGGICKRKVLIGEITINVHGYESPLLFAGLSSDESENLEPEAARFFAGHIESRFIYQLADFMRETEKRIVETDMGLKLVE